MPIITQPGESQKDFLSRCIPEMIKAGHPRDQSVAACINIFIRNEKKGIALELLEKSVEILKIQAEEPK